MRRRWVLPAIIAAFLAGQAAVLAALSVAMYRGADDPQEVLPGFLEFGREVDRRWSALLLRGEAPAETLPSYELSVAEADLARLESSLPSVGDVIDPDAVPWIPGILRFQDREIPVHARYHLASSVHWKHAKRSWEIRADGSETIGAARAVLLTLPETEGWLAPVLLAERNRSLSLLHRDASLAVLRINGTPAQIFLASAPWTPEAVAAQGRSPGRLYRIADERVVRENVGFEDAGYWEAEGSVEEPSDDAFALLLELSQPSAGADPDFLAKLAEIIDIERLQAVAVAYALHGNPKATGDALRFAYDPSRGRFEPVLWSLPETEPRSLLLPTGLGLLDNALRVPSIRSAVQKRLHEYIGGGKAGDDLAMLARLRANAERAAAQDPWKRPTNREVFRAFDATRRHAEEAIAMLEKDIATAGVLVTQRIPDAEDRERGVLLAIDLAARGPVAALLAGIGMPAVLTGALTDADLALVRDTGDGSYGLGDVDVPVSLSGAQLRLSAGDARLLWPGDALADAALEMLRPPHRRHRFFLIADGAIDDLAAGALPLPLDIRNAVTEEPASVLGVSVVDDGTFDGPPPASASREEFLAEHPAFHPDDENGVLLKGSVTLRETVVVPAAVRVRVAPGTHVRLGSGVSFISYGPVNAVGSAELPIVFERSGDEPWGTFALLDAADPSDVRFAVFRGGSRARLRGRLFDAMAVVRGSAVSIGDSVFEDAGGAHQLLLSRVFVDLRRSLFKAFPGDAVRVEHAFAGRIEDTEVREAGGTAIDIVDSSVVLRRVTVNTADTCIRLRGMGAPLLQDARLTHCREAVRAEEGTQAVAQHTTILDSRTGIVADGTRGSPPAAIVARETSFYRTDQHSLSLSGGIVTINEGAGARE